PIVHYSQVPRRPASTSLPYTTPFRSHNLKTQNGCLSCHDVEGRSGQVQYYRLGQLLHEEGLEAIGTCGSESSYCHAVGTDQGFQDRKSTRLNSSHVKTSYAVFCLKKK